MEAATVTPDLVLGIARQIVEQPDAAPKETRDGMRALLADYDDADDEDKGEILRTIVELFLNRPVEHEPLS